MRRTAAVASMPIVLNSSMHRRSKPTANTKKLASNLSRWLSSTSNTPLKDRAAAEINGIGYLAQTAEAPSYYKVKNLEALNTPASEYSPVYLSSELYFTSSRGDGKIYEAEGKPFTDLFKVTTKGANVKCRHSPGCQKASTITCETKVVSPSPPTAKSMIFAKGNSEKKKGDGADVDLYISRFRNDVWSEPLSDQHQHESEPNPTATQKLQLGLHACLSPDGRTLYFASNRKGGYGGTDIYSAQMDSRGRFTRVRNLGPEINTSGNRCSPM